MSHHRVSTSTKVQARGVSLQVGLLHPPKIACQCAKAKPNAIILVVVTTYLKYQTLKNSAVEQQGLILLRYALIFLVFYHTELDANTRDGDGSRSHSSQHQIRFRKIYKKSINQKHICFGPIEMFCIDF